MAHTHKIKCVFETKLGKKQNKNDSVLDPPSVVRDVHVDKEAAQEGPLLSLVLVCCGIQVQETIVQRLRKGHLA